MFWTVHKDMELMTLLLLKGHRSQQSSVGGVGFTVFLNSAHLLVALQKEKKTTIKKRKKLGSEWEIIEWDFGNFVFAVSDAFSQYEEQQYALRHWIFLFQLSLWKATQEFAHSEIIMSECVFVQMMDVHVRGITSRRCSGSGYKCAQL